VAWRASRTLEVERIEQHARIVGATGIDDAHGRFEAAHAAVGKEFERDPEASLGARARNTARTAR
jgi:hypothetical protein